MSRGAVAITGMGAVSALGMGCDALARALHDPVHGIGQIRRFPTDEFKTSLGAIVPGFETGDDPDRSITYAELAAREALTMAAFDPSTSRRVGLVLGSSLGSGRSRLAELTFALASRLRILGPCITVSTACSSSSSAVGLARDLLLSGSVDVALAGGTDMLSDELFAGFHALGVLSDAPCSPFSVATGTTLGEGAGMLLLETFTHATARRARCHATVLGYGLSSDAFHATSPDPTGAGIARAIRSALADAGVAPSAIDYVNAHGTGTQANDAAEVSGITAALGSHAEMIPISSSKSFLGHAQGAAGILEILVTLLGMREQRIPPTMHFVSPRRGAPRDPVPEARDGVVRVALSLNAAFAGANCAIVLGKRTTIEASSAPDRPVYVLGAAALAGDLRTLDELRRRIDDRSPVAHRVAPFRLEADVPMADVRGIDRSTRFLAATCARALRDARVVLRGELRERAAIIASASAFSTESVLEFRRSIDERGLSRLNATAFAKLVLNAPVGETARLLSLRGPTTTLTTSRGGGAIACACAADLLANGAGADLAIAAAFDELGEGDDASLHAEGAAALVLGLAPSASSIRLRRWCIAGPGDGAADAIRAALGGATPDLVLTDYGDVPVRAPSIALGPLLGDAPSATTAMACALAFETIRAGSAARVLVVARGGGASVALSFEREEM
ncbi:hypothetical protein BH09MYX1_BH09MYX1_36380 [soil metagenome]